MIFGKKIRELRDEQGVLQRQLAALLEIDKPMFSKTEGKLEDRYNNAKALKENGVPVHYSLEGLRFGLQRQYIPSAA